MTPIELGACHATGHRDSCTFTNSPRYPQSNGKEERAVKSATNVMMSADPYSALLSYRATPLECGHSPSQLLMGRQLRNKIPVVTSALEPRWIESKQLQDKQENIKRKQKNVRPLPSHATG